MLTFKQYLKEDEYNSRGYDLSTYVTVEMDFTVDMVEQFGFHNENETSAYIQMEMQLTEAFRKHFNDDSIDCFFSTDDYLMLSIHTTNFSSSHITSEADELIKYLCEYLESTFIARRTDLCFRQEIPAGLHSDFENILLYLPWAKPFTLKGIDKHFPNAKLFHINRPEKIIGNVLGLLKIKSLVQVTWEGKLTIPKWLEIINDELFSSTRNLVRCQKELYDNDLDDYAEL